MSTDPKVPSLIPDSHPASTPTSSASTSTQLVPFNPSSSPSSNNQQSNFVPSNQNMMQLSPQQQQQQQQMLNDFQLQQQNQQLMPMDNFNQNSISMGGYGPMNSMNPMQYGPNNQMMYGPNNRPGWSQSVMMGMESSVMKVSRISTGFQMSLEAIYHTLSGLFRFLDNAYFLRLELANVGQSFFYFRVYQALYQKVVSFLRRIFGRDSENQLEEAYVEATKRALPISLAVGGQQAVNASSYSALPSLGMWNWILPCLSLALTWTLMKVLWRRLFPPNPEEEEYKRQEEALRENYLRANPNMPINSYGAGPYNSMGVGMGMGGLGMGMGGLGMGMGGYNSYGNYGMSNYGGYGMGGLGSSYGSGYGMGGLGMGMGGHNSLGYGSSFGSSYGF
jgi:hypothetical protein